jgi:hypothetical protein
VGTEIREYVAVEAVCTAGIEWSARYARARVEDSLGEEVDIGRNDDVEGLVKGGVLLVADVSGENIDFDARVQFLDLGSCGLRALASVREDRHATAGDAHVVAHVCLADEELRA